MKALITGAVKYVCVFVVVLCVLFSFLLASAYIPDSTVQRHFEESADYMAGNDTVTLLNDFALSTKLDHYADCITLSIAYYLHGDNPLESIMWDYYYGENSNMMNEYFQESVKTDIEPNHEYLRYWHGSAAAMRLLHVFFNIRTVYIIHSVIMLALMAILIMILWKREYRGEAIAFVISMIASAVWIVPLCLEYTYTYLCMLVASIVAVMLVKKDKWLPPFFMVIGMITVFFDFLTTETLSLLIPLLLVLRIQRKERKISQLWGTAIKCCIAWGVAYLGMWAMKWVLSAIILHIDVMQYVTEHISERLNGNVVGYYLTGNFYLDALIKNIRIIFPLEYGLSGAVLVFAMVICLFIIPIATGKIGLRNKINCGRIALYAVLGMIPYVRYLVLVNHSYVHFFFTYRAQAATIMALCFMILELIWRSPKREAVKVDA